MRVSHIIRVRYLNLISNRIICRIAYLTRLLKYEIRIFNHTNIFYRTPVSRMTWITSDVSVSPGNKAFLDDVGRISIRRLSCWLDIGPTYTRLGSPYFSKPLAKVAKMTDFILANENFL